MEKFVKDLEEIKAKGLFRRLNINKKYKEDFSSSSYLSIHKKFIAKLRIIYYILSYGFGNCSSKYVGGYSKIHKKLEQTVSKYYNKESGLIFATGYMASIGVLQGIATKNTIVLIDRFIHTSWIDGILMTKCKFARFRHNDLQNLEALLQKYYLKFERVIILTETIFSMHGTVIDLQNYIDLAKKYNVILVTDHAHSHGVLKYKAENYNLHIIMGTFSKACGSIGGYVCGKKEIIETIVNFGKTQIYSTSLPNYLLAYNLWAFNFCIKNSGKMLKKTQKIAKKYNLEFKGSTILTKTFETNDEAYDFQNQLLMEDIFVPVIRKPTVEKPIVRFCVKI